MTKNTTSKARILELESLIAYHQNAYYNREPEITDYEFDALWDELKALDPENVILHQVGIDDFGFKKVKHLMPMGSQNKASNPEEFEKWYKQMVGLLGSEERFAVQYKLDGLSIELQYQDGRFIKAVTRGDGETGDDVSINILKTGCVVPEIKGFTGAIRGEVLLSHAKKDTYFPDKQNCRNAANGCLKRKDGVGCEHLDIIIYDALSSNDSITWSTEGEKIFWLQQTKYDTVVTKKFLTCQDIINYRSEVNLSRTAYAYDIDGIVVKCNTPDPEDMKRDRPKRQIAFKFVLEAIRTVLRDVEWSVSGKTRTPVGICEPVRINGTTVKRANLANYGLIKSLDLKIGDTVLLVKRGEIIPKIMEVVKTEPNTINKRIIPPKECEFCGTTLVQSGAYIICPNEKCPEWLSHKIQKWVKSQDIKFIGKSTIHKLVFEGHVTSLGDIYKKDFLLKLREVAGEAMAEKIWNNLMKRTALPLPSFVCGLDIDHIGKTIIENLMKYGYTTIDMILAASPSELCMCSGVELTLARHIKSGLEKVIPDINDLFEAGVTIMDTTQKNTFSGVSACFTGSFNQFERKELEYRFTAAGGKVSSKVSKNTAFLVSNNPDSTSGKTVAAKSLHIPIIDEQEFLRRLG
jgi:DNA ligase (NAD+)